MFARGAPVRGGRGRSFKKSVLSPGPGRREKAITTMNGATEVAANGRAEALVASYERAGYTRHEPAICVRLC